MIFALSPDEDKSNPVPPTKVMVTGPSVVAGLGDTLYPDGMWPRTRSTGPTEKYTPLGLK
jgi:hypothetical protein